MEKKMPYALYKKSYSDFSAHDYNAAKKEIVVDLPDYSRPAWPKSWKHSGNHFFTPNGATVSVWNRGLAENYVVETGAGFSYSQKTFPAGLYSRQAVIDYCLNL